VRDRTMQRATWPSSDEGPTCRKKTRVGLGPKAHQLTIKYESGGVQGRAGDTAESESHDDAGDGCRAKHCVNVLRTGSNLSATTALPFTRSASISVGVLQISLTEDLHGVGKKLAARLG
jgi:hypothetical protein